MRNQNMGLLDNKICVITGAAGSVEFATARRFLAEGARLMLVDRAWWILAGRLPA